MSKLIVHGGKALHGTVTPVANKNSIIKLIPAILLTDQPVTLHNVPKTSDVINMLEMVTLLGGTVEWLSDSSVKIHIAEISVTSIDRSLSQQMKSSVMFAWPLLARIGKAMMPMPQGCKLGARPMDVFIDNMVQMGATYDYVDGQFLLSCERLHGTDVWQRFPSVTGTENLILMAVCAEWTTTIYNAACEPHTQDLCNMLVSMGAQIDGIGSNKLIIQWVASLSGTTRTVQSDHLDVAWLIAATVMTGGEVTIQHAMTAHMGIMIQAMQKLWITLIVDHIADTITIPHQDTWHIHKTIKGDILELQAWPWPLLPMDIMPILLVLAMHCEGSAMVSNHYYTTQFFFIHELAKMKGRTVMADPHRIITFGPTAWKAADLLCSDIIQSSYGMLLAALVAEGTSTLNAITPLFRRFPNFVEQFRSLGAEIELVD